MLRAFSFDNGDDGHRDNSSSYRPLPRGLPSPLPPPPPPPHSHYHSPRPPIHGALPLPQERQPLRNNDDDYYYYDHHHHQSHSHSHSHTRQASSSSLSSSASSASFVARGGLGAPSPRPFQQQQQQQYYQRDMYSSPQQQQHALPVLPDAGGSGGEDARYDADRRPYFRAPAVGYPATDTTLHSAPPMSQATHVPLAGTPGSRFADPVPSPPTPALHFGADTSAAPPPPPRRGTDSPGNRVLNDPVGGHYTDNPYTRYSTTWDPQLVARQLQAADSEGLIFSDDEDDAAKGRSAGGIVTTGAAAGGAAVVGRSANTTPAGGLLGSSSEGGGSTMLLSEKARPSDWMQKQTHSKKKTRWIVALILVLVLLAAAGGATAGVLLSRKKSGASSAASGGNSGSITSGGGGGLTGSQDVAKNGDLNKDSPEIKALMSNTRLHRVFHGMDYTPLNSQFPDCLQNPPSQNNVTRDIAVMSLLTNKIRLYGNDCNQTEMVLHAISALAVPMTVWLGVWLDSNTTTNTRQLTHLYTLLSAYPSTAFEGVAVGNEVLFRENLSEQSLFSTIAAVRANMTARSITLPVATSDLGSNWKANMLPYVDVLMANVHPFFAGVIVEKAADWTWAFFRDNDVVLTTTLPEKSRPRVMISEVGWPSAGGAQGGSVAGVDQMNRFMVDFVCAQNKLGTEYYWFSAFDEPWKVVYNTPGKEWEDKWGLMDVNRDLKNGLVIPTCT